MYLKASNPAKCKNAICWKRPVDDAKADEVVDMAP